MKFGSSDKQPCRASWNKRHRGYQLHSSLRPVFVVRDVKEAASGGTTFWRRDHVRKYNPSCCCETTLIDETRRRKQKHQSFLKACTVFFRIFSEWPNVSSLDSIKYRTAVQKSQTFYQQLANLHQTCNFLKNAKHPTGSVFVKGNPSTTAIQWRRRWLHDVIIGCSSVKYLSECRLTSTH